MEKYRGQRHRLFSKFDQGIQLDEEGWYSVTPELIARHIAIKCAQSSQSSVIVDAFCGVGGNTIQFAHYFDRVIAVDISSERLEMARINSKIYGVEDRITFICGDFIKLLPTLASQLNLARPPVFLSPPWGGPKYLDSVFYDLDQTKPVDVKSLVNLCREWLSNELILFLPRNSNIQQLLDVVEEIENGSHSDLKSLKCELELNYFGDKLKTMTIFIGSG